MTEEEYKDITRNFSKNYAEFRKFVIELEKKQKEKAKEYKLRNKENE
jgi:hypothetical protein